jgi:hypothetical protein
MSLEPRLLKYKIDLAPAGGAFADGSTTKTLRGFRSSVSVQGAGGATMTTAQVRIFGLSEDTMHLLTLTGGTLVDPNHTSQVAIFAGTQEPLAQIFQGAIFQGWANIQAPDASFDITAHEGMIGALTPGPPTTEKGGADVAQQMQVLAGNMHYHFENSGVTAQVNDPYLAGTWRDQAYSLAAMANINIIIENGLLAIWPKDQARRTGGDPIVVSPTNGMVGYPTFTEQGLTLRTLFRPDIPYGVAVTVHSHLQNAQGQWTIFQINHELECQVPGGKWFTEIQCSKFGQTPPLPGG